MAADIIVMDGDMVNFMPACGAAIVVVQPGKMKASGKTTLNGTKVCVEGDEANVQVPGCSYMTPAFPVPGTGTLKIDSLAPDQLTQKTKSRGKAIVLQGATFDSVFEVQSPAQFVAPPAPPQMDSAPSYKGKGQLITANIKIKAT